MNELFHDIWHDLREKRLWPVAVALLLATVAIPAVLTKSAAQPPATAPVVATPEPDDRVTVQLDGGGAASSGEGSALDKFAEGDPFTPPVAIARAGGGDRASSATVSGPTSGGGDTGAGAGGGAGGGDTGSPPSSAPDAPADPPPPTTRTETAEYEYVVDVIFWHGPHRRKMRGLRKLDMLPSQRAPVLIFMGTSGNGGNAVFLVDSTLKGAGEGRCIPNGANCAYVRIGPGSEHAFTTEDGESYRLRIEEIRRVDLKSDAARRRRSARASAGNATAGRRFELPSLADLVAVTETETVQAAGPEPENRSSVAADGR